MTPAQRALLANPRGWEFGDRVELERTRSQEWSRWASLEGQHPDLPRGATRLTDNLFALYSKAVPSVRQPLALLARQLEWWIAFARAKKWTIEEGPFIRAVRSAVAGIKPAPGGLGYWEAIDWLREHGATDLPPPRAPAPLPTSVQPSPVVAVPLPPPPAPELRPAAAPTIAPALLPEPKEAPMAMIQQLLSTATAAAQKPPSSGGITGIVESAITAAGQIGSALIARQPAPSEPAAFAPALGALAGTVGTIGRAVLSKPGAAAAAGAAAAGVLDWALGEGGPVAFTTGRATARPVRFIEAANPATGRLHFWEHVGRPVLFSRDLAACRRVSRIAARARRAYPRRPITIRRRKKT